MTIIKPSQTQEICIWDLPTRLIHSWQRLLAEQHNHFEEDLDLDDDTLLEIQTFSAEIWQHPDVNFQGNCGACHLDAEQGTFEDAAMRLPSSSVP